MYFCAVDAIGQRLKTLREKAGLDTGNLAEAIGISATWFDDLENGEGELEETLDLEQIRQLALLLHVTIAELLTGTPAPAATRPMTFKDLARHIRRRLENETGLESLEEECGWDLGGFVKRPDTEGWGQRVGFFRDVCGMLAVDWLGIVAYADSMIEGSA